MVIGLLLVLLLSFWAHVFFPLKTEHHLKISNLLHMLYFRSLGITVNSDRCSVIQEMFGYSTFPCVLIRINGCRSFWGRTGAIIARVWQSTSFQTPGHFFSW